MNTLKKTPLDIENKEQFLKYLMYLRAYNNQQHLINKLRQKDKIRVVFIVYLVSMWKLDNVLKLMKEDDYFEPIIFVAPFQGYDDEKKQNEFTSVVNYFKNKNVEVVSSWDNEKEEYKDFDELNADLVFFSNPWDYSNGLYYSNIYENYLCCYIKYGIGTAAARNNLQYNMPFHNYMWQIYSSDKYDLHLNQELATSQGKNVILTGAPYLEDLLNNTELSNPWKNNDNRKKIIFAPHHTIEVDSRFNYRLSNFLDLAEDIKNLAIKYQEKAVWCFKPHPHLKEKLYSHPQWGKIKTDKYYSFWKNSEFSQISEGDYLGLFKYSDALIHDSASFLVEFLATKKPVLYLTSKYTNKSLNELGLEALSAGETANKREEIKGFIKKLLNDNLPINEKQEIFYERNFSKLYADTLPSESIIYSIKRILNKSNL